MKLLLTRIDNRLIHGQVLEAWVPSLNANCIIVANDKIANATMQKLLMEASVPRGIRVFISTLDEAAEVMASEDLANARVLLLFATSDDALEGYRSGIKFGKLNLGNMHAGEGKMQCSCTIALAPGDVENLRDLEESGVRIYSQCVPTDRQVSWHKMLKLAEGQG